MRAALACAWLAWLLAGSARAADADYLSFATEDEANTTEIFSRASPAVVYVTNTALRRSFFSL
ncbi:MAG: 2-alkenal reductase, partial [Halioglobus sp.]|nr:2-alkenal reductase [Halioglobus sp.]